VKESSLFTIQVMGYLEGDLERMAIYHAFSRTLILLYAAY
jgi:hypothetical protein